MTICDKINEVGKTLQENLNDRGVSCTFGTGTGESTILEMVEMVNGTNFKGSSDVNLKIGANRPYLLENETTDVIVKLEDGLCEPLANKSVTVSDGTNTINGVTDEKGEFALYDVSVTDDTTFTASYGTETATCLVEYCIFADYNDPNNYIIRDTTTSNCSLENGAIKIANTTSGNISCFFTLNSDAITGNFKVTYDLQTSSTVTLYQRIGTTRTSNDGTVNGDINHTTFKKVEWILQDGTMTVKIDGTTWKTTTYTTGTYYPIFAFYFNVGEYVYIRNLRIK